MALMLDWGVRNVTPGLSSFEGKWAGSKLSGVIVTISFHVAKSRRFSEKYVTDWKKHHERMIGIGHTPHPVACCIRNLRCRRRRLFGCRLLLLLNY